MLGPLLRALWYPVGPAPKDDDKPEPVESLDSVGDLMAPVLRGYGYTTVDAIRNASVTELAALDPVPQRAAAKIYRDACDDAFPALEDTIEHAQARAEAVADRTAPDGVGVVTDGRETWFVDMTEASVGDDVAGVDQRFTIATDKTVDVEEVR